MQFTCMIHSQRMLLQQGGALGRYCWECGQLSAAPILVTAKESLSRLPFFQQMQTNVYCRLKMLSLTQTSAISRKYLGQIRAASQTEAAAKHDAVPSHQRRKKGCSCYPSCLKTTTVL